VIAWSGATAGRQSGIGLTPIDLADTDSLERAFLSARPTAVIHAAALASVADCFRDPPRAARINTAATEHLARLSAAAGIRLVLVSTDLVFDGEHAPYTENAAPSPLSVYGRTKADAEQAALAWPGHVVARVSLLYGPSLSGKAGFFDLQVGAL